MVLPVAGQTSAAEGSTLKRPGNKKIISVTNLEQQWEYETPRGIGYRPPARQSIDSQECLPYKALVRFDQTEHCPKKFWAGML